MPERRRARPRRGPGRPPGGQGRAGRDALLQAARAVMTEKGLPRVTAREVAARAGVQPALVNYYFGGKQGLLQAVTEAVASEMLDRLRRSVAAEGSVAERLRSLIQGWIAALAQDPYAPRLIVEQVLFADAAAIEDFVERFGRANLEALRSLFEEGRASGQTRGIEPMFLLPSLIGMCVFYFLTAPLQQRLFGVERITPELAERFAEHSAELILHGLARPGANPS